MKIELNDGATFVITFVITFVTIAAILIVAILFAGCADNRIHTTVTLDDRYKNPELRLHLTRMMWAEAQLRHYEKASNYTGND